MSRYDDPEAWVRRVACNRAISRWRRARRIVLRSQTSDGLHLDPEQQAAVAALAQLNQQEREAIALHHLVGYSVEELARQLGAPAGTVKSRLSRGRVRLADLLGAEEVTSHER